MLRRGLSLKTASQSYVMNNRTSTVFAVVLLVIGFAGSPVAAQDEDFGQRYVTLSDAEIWSQLMKCKDRKELESLINRIPISVLAIHAEQAWKAPKKEPDFGNFVNWIIWPEFMVDGEPNADGRRLVTVLPWKDSSGQYDVQASIFDVQETIVILRMQDGSLRSVPVEKLAKSSAMRVERCGQLRRKFLERLPARPELLPELIKRRMSRGDLPASAAVVLAIQSVDEILAKANYLAKAAQIPEITSYLEFLLRVNFMKGVDRGKPAGAVLMFKGKIPHTVGCLPVTNFRDVLSTLGSFDAVRDDTEGVIQLALPFGTTLFATEKDGWAFFSTSRGILTELPGDPDAIFSPLTERYLISLSVKVPSFPDSLGDETFRENSWLSGRENWVTFRSQLLAASQLPRWILEGAYQSLDPANKIVGDPLSDMNEIILGWAVEIKDKQTYFDFSLDPLGSTQLAKRMAAAGSLESEFSGFYREDAAVAFHWSANLIEDDKEPLIGLIDQFENRLLESTLSGTSEAIVDLWFAELKPIIRSGKIDSAASLVVDDDSINFIAGVYTTDRDRINESITELIERIQKENEVGIDIELNTETFDGATFHKLDLAVPETETQVRKIFGGTLEVVIGVEQQAVYFGVGRDSLQSIKTAIEQSRDGGNVKRVGMRCKVALQPIFELADRIEGNETAQALAEFLKQSGHDDIISSLQMAGASQTFRLEVQEGILGLYRAAASLKPQPQL